MLKPGYMDMVNSRLENGVGKFTSRICDHHAIMSVTEEIEFVIKIAEEESTVVSTLDIGLDGGTNSHGAHVSQRHTNFRGLFI